MALSKIDAVNFLTGTIPSGNIATSSLAAAATGKVLQVVSATKTDTTSLTIGDTNFVDISGLSLSITPASSSNKIFVIASVVYSMNNDTYGTMLGLRLQRGSTALGAGGNSFSSTTITGENETSTYAIATVPIQFLDSPSSTSALTYKVTAKNWLGGDVTGIINGRKNGAAAGSSTITAYEIAG